MSKKPKKTAPAPRDPYWRTRRALGAKRVASTKQYDRADEKEAERTAKYTPPEREEP
jgi:hypothetical protein